MKILNSQFKISKKFLKSKISLLSICSLAACLELQENSVGPRLEEQSELVEQAPRTEPIDPLNRKSFCCELGENCHMPFKIDVLGEKRDITFSFEREKSKRAEMRMADHFLALEMTEDLASKRAQVCEGGVLVSEQATKDGMVDVLSNLLMAYYPACGKPSLQNNSWQCSDNGISVSEQVERVEGLKRFMAKKWVGHPYVLARRVTVTKQLLSVVENQIEDKNFTNICSIIRKSMDSELPLIMQSKEWQGYLCEKEPSIRTSVAKRGITLALLELEFFTALAERSNKKGTLLVKVPQTDPKSRLLWVDLKASKDVGQSLINHALQIQVERASHGKEAQGNIILDGGVWDPFFQRSANLFEVAKLIGLFEFSAVNSQKRMVALEKDSAVIASYLLRTIIGESSFVVSNGRSKLLRLPMGSYEYSLVYYHGAGRDKWWKPSPENRSSGQFHWGDRHPWPSIQSW